MDRATVSRIEDWDARPVAGGYAGLADLADSEFTGAVASGRAHLFMLNGRVVGVSGGSISAFEGADSTAYTAPDPALPLLFAMQDRGGEVRGQYYTDDTPLREVDATLKEGGFTGYLELSENVLSGDYFVVYYGGRSLAAAFVGNRERVVTGDEAFQLAADEVGIYEVRAVELEVTDVPEPPEDASTDAAAAGGAAGATGAGAAAEGATDDAPAETEADGTHEPGNADVAAIDEAEPPEEPIDEADTATSPAAPDEAGEDDVETAEDDGTAEPESTDSVAASAQDARDEEPVAAQEPGTAADGADTGDTPAVAEAEPRADEDERPDDGGGRAPEASASSEPQGGEGRPSEPEDQKTSAGHGRTAEAGSAGGAGEPEERFREEERWREARTVPALDPEETELPTATDETEPEVAAESTAPEPAEPQRRVDREEPDRDEVADLRARVRELESELEETDRARRRQAGRVEELEEEREDLVEEREALQARIEELEAELSAKEERLEAQEAEIAAGAGGADAPGGATVSAAEAIDPETALDQTDLFVRYASKGKATLQTAHDGGADREAVAENLRLESHSRFDPGGVTVQGRPFEDFLADTIEYRFVSWLIEELLYEIQGTGNERGLRAVYDALPQIDRAEFDGTVTSLDDAGEEGRETFDVVCRDRMGKPLVVANINDSLDPATGDMMGDLVEDATAAGEAHESICAAFQVTASFFEPDALETAADATGGGFLSRDSKKSFVKLSRKGGYHLCLVEARGGDFHVAVPEL